MAAQDVYGRRLLPSLLDQLELQQPCRVFLSVPNGRVVEDGYTSITIEQFARAVHHCAWKIERELGRGQGFPTIGYIGPQDARYLILTLACNKTGYKLFLPSPRNSLDGLLSLLDALDCRIFFIPDLVPPLSILLNEICSRRSLRTIPVEGLDQLFNIKDVARYPYTLAFETGVNDPIAVFHTSGSTGMPKPVVVKHRSFTAMDAGQRDLPPPALQITHYRGKRSFLPFPLFHMAGMQMLILGLFCEMTVVFPPYAPLTAHMVDSVHKSIDIELTVLPPSILADIASDDEYLERMNKIPMTLYGGGPIPPSAGTKIASRTHLHTGFGSTEVSWFLLAMLPSSDWQYLRFSPVMGYRMEHYLDDLYELVLHKKSQYEDFQPIFSIFPDLNVYPTNDLFSKHPAQDDLWYFRGRRDDIIVYSTGEKMNPSTIEGIISGHPKVNAALLYGQGHAQSVLILEPKLPVEDKDILTLELWTTIQEANESAPTYGRITKEMVIYTSPDKPLPKAGKGTIQRQMAYSLYEEELSEVYTAAKFSRQTKASVLVLNENRLTGTAKVLAVARTLDGFENLEAHTSLFERGLDSLQANTLLNRLSKTTLNFRQNEPSTKTIFASSTIEDLAARLVEGNENVRTSTELMQEVFEKYIEDLPITARVPEKRSTDDQEVLLTGSTGSLGRYLLHELLSDPKIRTVYCLGRGTDLEARQTQIMTENGMAISASDNSRVKFIVGDVKKPHLGLSLASYHELLRNVTLVLHNAWSVDFNQPLERIASTHLLGVQRILKLCTQSRYGASLFFISSASAVMKWKPKYSLSSARDVPEEMFDSWSVAEDTGYSQSKAVAERVIWSSAIACNIPTIICRIGLIAGPTTARGSWPKQEWLPTLIASSKQLGKLPNSLASLEVVDWMPVDIVASVIHDLCSKTLSQPSVSGSQPNIYHVANPHRTTWSQLQPIVQETLGSELVSPAEWIQALEQSLATSAFTSAPIPETTTVSSEQSYPAANLADFYRYMLGNGDKAAVANLATTRTLEASPRLASLGPVSHEWMQLWLKQWGYFRSVAAELPGRMET